MNNYIKGEFLKSKKSFSRVLIWLAPIVCFGMAYLIVPMYVQLSAYNWWYLLFLPFLAAYIISAIISQEKKHNYHGLFGIINNKSKLWNSKIIVVMSYLILSNTIFCILSIFTGIVLGQQTSTVNNILACVVLSIGFAWQIPLFMWIARKSNIVISVLVSMAGNLVVACMYATESTWWIPFAIPARLMCYVIHVLPNGLLIDSGTVPTDYETIAIGGGAIIFSFMGYHEFSARIYMSTILLIFFSNSSVYVLQYCICYTFGKGVSLGVGIIETLLSPLLCLGLGDDIWMCVPCSYGARMTSYHIVDVMKKGEFYQIIETEYRKGFTAISIVTILCFAVFVIWTRHWQGTSFTTE